uniref:Uncharacterized protein n=1 Tax=Crocodylus porosus TaxID=8502 RepID=A0A7M4EUJ1_CROPO
LATSKGNKDPNKYQLGWKIGSMAIKLECFYKMMQRGMGIPSINWCGNSSNALSPPWYRPLSSMRPM